MASWIREPWCNKKKWKRCALCTLSCIISDVITRRCPLLCDEHVVIRRIKYKQCHSNSFKVSFCFHSHGTKHTYRFLSSSCLCLLERSQQYRWQKNSFFLFFFFESTESIVINVKMSTAFTHQTISCNNNNGKRMKRCHCLVSNKWICSNGKAKQKKLQLYFVSLALSCVRQFCVNSSISIRFVVFSRSHFDFILFLQAYEFFNPDLIWLNIMYSIGINTRRRHVIVWQLIVLSSAERF